MSQDLGFGAEAMAMLIGKDRIWGTAKCAETPELGFIEEDEEKGKMLWTLINFGFG